MGIPASKGVSIVQSTSTCLWFDSQAEEAARGSRE
jgi:hypothetical protein